MMVLDMTLGMMMVCRRMCRWAMIALGMPVALWAQEGRVEGLVQDKLSQEPIPFVTVQIQGTELGAVTGEDGRYAIEDLEPGAYNLEARCVGYEPFTLYEVEITRARVYYADITLTRSVQQLEEVVVSSYNSFAKTEEAPLALRSIGVAEIKRMPGSNRDISGVLRSLPGVASTPSFRNDILIRGGGPGEIVFYVDDIETPIINHFQTQGSSGGPVGILNVDMISNVDFYSGAFPASRGDALSADLEFSFKKGRQDRWTVNAVTGLSDLALSAEGPISKKSSLIFSVRRSFLRYVFAILELPFPFIPLYNDLQFKYHHALDEHSSLTLLGIGALDDFSINDDFKVDEQDTEDDRIRSQNLLDRIPINDQWSYTAGAKYERRRSTGLLKAVLSRNHLKNRARKYEGNDESNPSNRLLDYNSQEIETHIRLEDYQVRDVWTFNYGANYTYAQYLTESFFKTADQSGPRDIAFDTELDLHRWGLFFQTSRVLAQKLTLSLGARVDASGYSEQTRNPLEQFSPRVSASYQLNRTWALNAHAGLYYQLPAYTVLGYRDSDGRLVNRDNKVTYIRQRQVGAGVAFNLLSNARVTVEGFYKYYDKYPFLTERNVALANLGADFGPVGNAVVESTAEGRSYGVEFLFQQKLYKGFYGIVTYTLYKSEFSDAQGDFISSSWDYRHLVSITGGKRFRTTGQRTKKNWEIGFRWLLTGPSPYTPYDLPQSLDRESWDRTSEGILDYASLNTERTAVSHQLDLRIDRKYFFAKWSLNFYLDFENLYDYRLQVRDILEVVRDDEGNPVPDPNAPSHYQPSFLSNEQGNRFTTFGIIVEF